MKEDDTVIVTMEIVWGSSSRGTHCQFHTRHPEEVHTELAKQYNQLKDWIDKQEKARKAPS